MSKPAWEKYWMSLPRTMNEAGQKIGEEWVDQSHDLGIDISCSHRALTIVALDIVMTVLLVEHDEEE
jgi:hypothetical protein